MGLLSKLFGKKQEPSKSTPETGKSHIKVFKVAGVTFKGRQKLLKQLKGDKKAGKVLNVQLEEYDYKGEPAIKVLVNGLDVGNLHVNQERILGINDFTIGEHYDENEKTSYNAKVKLLIANKS
jgi:hypothetical protein